MAGRSIKRHTPEEIDSGLIAYFRTGSYRKAEKLSGVPRATLSDWVTETHQARYEEIAARLGPEIEQGLIDRYRRTAALAAEAADEAIDATRQAMTVGESKDASAYSTAARNLATVAGISTDKTLVLQGKPTTITQHTSAEDALKSLASMVGVTLEGTAEEIQPAQLTTPPAT